MTRKDDLVYFLVNPVLHTRRFILRRTGKEHIVETDQLLQHGGHYEIYSWHRALLKQSTSWPVVVAI